jgi:hypothetical protein
MQAGPVAENIGQEFVRLIEFWPCALSLTKTQRDV